MMFLVYSVTKHCQKIFLPEPEVLGHEAIKTKLKEKVSHKPYIKLQIVHENPIT